MNVEIEWDPDKNKINIKKHGLSFEEASVLFSAINHLVLEIYDHKHSIDEDRIISIGPITRGIVVVVATERDEDVIRIMSARFATKSEISIYNKGIYGETNEL